VEDTLRVVLAIAVAAALVILAACAFIAWRVWRSGERALAKRIGKLSFRKKLALGGALFRDPRVPLWSRGLAVALAVYLALPLDIIPDFIPVIGFLDDLLIVLVAAGLLIRSIPDHVLNEHLARLEESPRGPVQ
jgi:uncharacterized membrane protein YkvA (DUF1232 family)